MLKKYVFPTGLILIALFLCFRNYSPGTYLIGWDSLHPEFNFPEAFRRIWEGVWRGEQGVGAIAAHSHMSDWPRIVFLWLESFVLPTSFLRYSYVFLCLILGPLGMYFLLNYVFKRERENIGTYLSAFLGALFYLLNLGTLQQFFVPFDMFPTQFAFLPWLILFAIRVLRERKKRNYILFAVFTLLASPQAYAAILFYAYLGALTIFCFVYFLLNHSGRTFKRGLVLVILTVFLNLYWILPNIYSAVNQSQTIINAKINLLFTPEAYLRNLGYEGLRDILIQKNMLFDWRAFDYSRNQFTDLMQVWNNHLAAPFVLPILYVLAGASLLGAAISVFKKDRIGISVLAMSLYALFFLTGGGRNSDILSEALRMPYTKFSIIFDFCLAFYFGYFFFVLTRLIKLKGFVASVLVIFALIYTTWPVFTGNLISPVVKRNFPNQYFELFEWFNKNSNGRVAVLPMMNLWGWDYHSWKYEGSGFLTYGIKNPLLVRDFDRWSSGNEDFYKEASFALYDGETDNFIKILQKYQVKYLLLDESIVNPGGSSSIAFVPEIKNILASSPNVSKEAQFGFLSVYKVKLNQNEISAPDHQYNSFPVNSYEISFFNASPSASPIIENLTRDRGQEMAVNCDLYKVGTASKKVTMNGIFYTADEGGVSCDNFNYLDIKYSQGFILRITGNNIRGRSLKIYLFNLTTNQPDLQELLPSGAFDKYFYIHPKNSEGSGYSLNLETRSFKGVQSSNLLSKVEFYPVTLQGTTLQGVYSNDLTIDKVQKYGTWAYKVDVQGNGLLQLGQGYESGWVAVKVGRSWSELVNSKTNSVADKLRLISTNFNLLPHVKVNGWANGWTIDANSLQSTDYGSAISGRPSTIVLVYWPQLLEWGGMGIGIISLLVVIFTKIKRS